MLNKIVIGVRYLSIISFVALINTPSVMAKSNSGLAFLGKIKEKLFDYSLWASIIIGIILLFVIYLITCRKKKTKGNGEKEIVTIQNIKNNVTPGNAQHIGTRTEQQDAFAFSDVFDDVFIKQFGVLAILADGMGGLMGGKEVSRIAVQSFLEHYLHSPYITSIPEKLASSVEVANDAVLQFARENALEGCVGTTLIAAAVHNEELHWLSVGDSRIFLFQEENFIQLTTDHIYAKELDKKVANGLLTEEEAMNDPQRNSLTSFLGLEFIEEIDMSFEPVILHKGAKVLLCSDGLYGSVTYEEFLQTCRLLPAQDAAEKLIKLMLEKDRANQDNATIAILSIN